MAYKFEDDVQPDRRVGPPCALSPEDCKQKHQTVDDCDRYRQQLLEEEHKKTCPHILKGQACTHFNTAVKGGSIPNTAKFQGLSPAEFLVWSRGLKN